jgi:hypothetical protein
MVGDGSDAIFHESPANTSESKITKTLIEHDRLRKGAEAADLPHILVEFDHNANCNFFHNTQTGQKGWDLASVHVAAASADDIEQRFDPKTNMPYFFNKATGQSGWSREAVMMGAAAAAGTESVVEERLDPSSKRTYFFNKQTGKSAWSREEVEETDADAGTPSTLDDEAYDSDDADDTIEEKFDDQHQRAYFVNKKTGQTGWNKEAVRRKHSMMQTLSQRMPALRSQIAEDVIDEDEDEDDEDDESVDAEEDESVIGSMLRRVSQSVLPLVATGAGSGLGAGSLKTVEVSAVIDNPTPANCGITFQLQGKRPQERLVVRSVRPHSPAAGCSDVRIGDTLLAINGQQVAAMSGGTGGALPKGAVWMLLNCHPKLKYHRKYIIH